MIDQFFREMPEAIGKLPTFQEALASAQKQSIQQGVQQGVQQGIQQGVHHVVIRQIPTDTSGS